jgi:hypothetical protein
MKLNKKENDAILETQNIAYTFPVITAYHSQFP